MERSDGADHGRAITRLLCYAAALVEGFDLQSAGVTAPRFGPVYRLTSGQIAEVFSFNTAGLFVGAIIGGWIADRLGRKTVLVAALLAFGLFSIATAYAPNAEILIVMRFLTGLGLGGAFPNIISIISESGPSETSSARVTAVTSGMPLGGVICGLIVFLGGAAIDWRVIFYIGGWAPILLAPALWLAVPESSAFRRMKIDRAAGHVRPAERKRNIPLALFGERRAIATVALWGSFFFVQVAQSLLLNWLPVLLVSKGFGKPEATIGAMAFSSGNVIGALALGWLILHGSRRVLMAITYAGLAAALIVLATIASSFSLVATAIILVGSFLGGALFTLYGLSPTVYPVAVRGTGVGFGIAAGRLGAIAGPALAGIVLSMPGAGPTQVLISLLPAIVLAAVATFVLNQRQARMGLGTPSLEAGK